MWYSEYVFKTGVWVGRGLAVWNPGTLGALRFGKSRQNDFSIYSTHITKGHFDAMWIESASHHNKQHPWKKDTTICLLNIVLFYLDIGADLLVVISSPASSRNMSTDRRFFRRRRRIMRTINRKKRMAPIKHPVIIAIFITETKRGKFLIHVAWRS